LQGQLWGLYIWETRNGKVRRSGRNLKTGLLRYLLARVNLYFIALVLPEFCLFLFRIGGIVVESNSRNLITRGLR
jgi:hypothetical protein